MDEGEQKVTDRSKSWSRRGVLRGAAAALALPFLEGLAPQPAQGLPATPPLRFLTLFFPDGVGDFWKPEGEGTGDAWQLSPLLLPLAALKTKITVISHLQNYTPTQERHDVQPAHSRATASFLTCVDMDQEREIDPIVDVPSEATSFDQALVRLIRPGTPIPSLQLGLSTFAQFCDGRDCGYSRSISWENPATPLFKDIDPRKVFDQLMGASGTGLSQKQAALNQSVLDAVYDSARSTRARLGASDRHRLDEYLESVRSLEQRVTTLPLCTFPPRPEGFFGTWDRDSATFEYDIQNGQEGYDRGVHAQIMNDLIVLALRCDLTRVITHMFDDARSDFVYNHLTTLAFGSRDYQGEPVGAYHPLLNSGSDHNGLATITHWFSTLCADICTKLDAIDEGDGTLLDHTVVYFASQLKGPWETSSDLPVVLLGGKAGGLRQDAHLILDEYPADRPLRDLYFTLANDVFQVDLPEFGKDVTGAEHQQLTQILA